MNMKPCTVCGAENPLETYRPKQGGKCAACIAVYMRAYRADNAARIAQSKKRWVEAHIDRKAAQDAALAKQYPERRREARRKWEAQNQERARALKHAYRKANLPKVSAWQAKRRAAQLQRTPAWLTEDDLWLIEEAYLLAALRTKCFGFEWHVDHVFPLQGRSVSGLHVPTNLQVIPGAANVRKGNRYEAGVH